MEWIHTDGKIGKKFGWKWGSSLWFTSKHGCTSRKKAHRKASKDFDTKLWTSENFEKTVHWINQYNWKKYKTKKSCYKNEQVSWGPVERFV